MEMQNKKHLILIVDDDPDALKLLKEFLKLSGFDTITCINVKKAISVLEERYLDISLILLDVMMPGMSSMEVLRQLKAEERYNHIKVIFLTEGPQNGYGYIRKPFSLKDLLKSVQDTLK